MRSLRLVAPAPERATAGKENGASSGNGLAALTDQERKIMRLVACGLSNKQIARQLRISTGTIKARLDQISTLLEAKGRTEVAAFALSRLFGGLGALAALIFAALDDVKAADATAFGHEPTDTFTVMTADGTAITVKINARETTAASGKTAKAASKAGRVENLIAETPGRADKLIPSSIDIALGSIMPALTSARAGLGSYGAFMVMAAGVWIYELLNSAAQASSLGESPTLFASASEGGAAELAALKSPGSADANLDSFVNLAWLHPETYDQSFAFAVAGSETIAGSGDDLQIIAADAGEDSVSSNGHPHVGAGAIDVPIEHGGFEQEAAADTSGHTEHDRMQPAAGDELHAGQSQRDLHAAEASGAAAEQHGKHGSPEDDSNHGQSQHNLHESKDGTAAAQHARHAPAEGAHPVQQQRDLHASENGSAAAAQHAGHDAKPASGANPGQSQRESHEPSVNASTNPHARSSQHAGDTDQAADAPGQPQKAAAPELGDSFHFRSDIATSNVSSISEVPGGHGPDSIEHDPHTAGNGGLALIQDADLIGPSHAEQSAVDHARGAEHHLMHDFLL
jgi:VCBS repeat-containing protein